MKTFRKKITTFAVSAAMVLQYVGWMLLPADATAVTLNLKNADIRSLINTVAQATKRNFIIDPRVGGKVTVLISQELPPDALYQIFLSILKVHGFVAIEGEYVTKILPANLSKSASAYVSKRYPEELTTIVVPIRYINAQQIIPVLRPFVSPTSLLSVYAPTNVLIIHDTLANIRHLRKIIAQVDKPLDKNFDVIQIKHASASEVSKIINTFVAKNPNDPAAKEVKLATDLRTNRLIVHAKDDRRLQVRALVADLDIAEAQGSNQVIYLRYADAKKMLPLLQGVLGSGDKKAASAAGSVAIQADEATNSLIITAPKDLTNQIDSIKKVIRRLDIRRAQVLIEAIIAEVNQDSSDQLGFQLVSNTNNIVGLVNFNNQIPSLITSVRSNTAPSVPLGSSLLVGRITNRDRLEGWGGILSALKSSGDANILSTPVLVTLDNQQASILVGREVPFISNTQLSASNTNPFQNFERRDVGITLKVKPQINEGDTVQLEIEQEISNVLPSAGAVDTITSKRTLKTTVLVEDGKTLVLGGLIDDQTNEATQKIPLLGDLPLIGFLFRFESETTRKRNLMIFIRPTVLRSGMDLEHATSGKYNFIREQQRRVHEKANVGNPPKMILEPLDSTNVIRMMEPDNEAKRKSAAPPIPPFDIGEKGR